jgi:Fur family ferric uptake transcriptional regulator
MSPGVADRVLERIHHSGGRSTLPTRLVVTILSETEHHLTADDLINEVERRAPGIAPSTVYRVLQRLEELEVLKHVHSGGGAAFYHLREHAHAHLRCTDCGAITDVSQEVAAALRSLEEAASRAQDFALDSHHSALLGRCRLCSDSAHPHSVAFQKV